MQAKERGRCRINEDKKDKLKQSSQEERERGGRERERNRERESERGGERDLVWLGFIAYQSLFVV